jgi:phosphatidylethanolamine/phosphatidyl-N-methylethanolamine N-methyltransferase
VDDDPAQAALRSNAGDAVEKKLDNTHVEEAYARWAPVYDLVFAAVMRPGRKAVAAAANRLTGSVLDVGVGTGLELPMFERHLRLVGIDLSEPMLRRARARVRTEALHHVAGLVLMDALQLGFCDAAFDAVVVPYVLTVVPKPKACLDEWLRVVRKGGWIILVNHIGAETGLMAMLEAWLGKHSASLGWRPEFPWSVIGDWIAAHPEVELVERRRLAPFGAFTLTRIRKL